MAEIAQVGRNPLRRSRAGRLICGIVILIAGVVTLFWLMRSPMLKMGETKRDQLQREVLMTTSTGPRDRVEFFRDLVIPADESVESATCIFCSVRVQGTVEEDVVTLWGGVEVEGYVGKEITALGGGIQVRSTANLSRHSALEAVGGPVILDPGLRPRDPYYDPSVIDANRFKAIPHPNLFYPGQREFYFRGLSIFFVFMTMLPVMGCLLKSTAGVEKLAGTVEQKPWQCLLMGVGVIVVGVPLFCLVIRVFISILGAALYFFPLLWVVPAIGLGSALWLVFVGGFAGISLCVGRTVGAIRRRIRGDLAQTAAGGALLAILMMIPVVGFLVLLVTCLLVIGSVALVRWERGWRGM